MNTNYIPFPISYDKEAILSVLPQVHITGRMSDTRCTSEQCKTLNSLLPLKGLINYVLNFQLNPNVSGDPHIDKPLLVALIVPLLNGNNVTLNWFRKKESIDALTDVQLVGPSTPTVIGAKLTELDVYDTVTFDRPYLIKVDDWHSINNVGDDVARVLSVRFPLSFESEKLLKLFGPA